MRHSQQVGIEVSNKSAHLFQLKDHHNSNKVSNNFKKYCQQGAEVLAITKDLEKVRVPC